MIIFIEPEYLSQILVRMKSEIEKPGGSARGKRVNERDRARARERERESESERADIGKGVREHVGSHHTEDRERETG